MPAIIVDPALQAAVIRQFNLRGELAPFNLTENVVPVFDIGNLSGNLPTVVTTLLGSQGVRVGTLNSSVSMPVNTREYDNSTIDASGRTTNPMAGDVIADTGARGVGLNQVHWVVASDAALKSLFTVEWRNAANSATLTSWSFIIPPGGGSVPMFSPLTLSMAASERVRIVTPAAIVGDVFASVGFSGFSTSIAS